MVELDLTRGNVEALMLEIWLGCVGTPIVCSAQRATPPAGARHADAAVTFRGGWAGAVLVSMPAALAERAASLVFALAEPQEPDLCDVVGEIANMIAGRLKQFLPTGTQMSLPVVTIGEQHRTTIQRPRLAFALSFLAEGLPLSVVVAHAPTASQKTES